MDVEPEISVRTENATRLDAEMISVPTNNPPGKRGRPRTGRNRVYALRCSDQEFTAIGTALVRFHLTPGGRDRTDSSIIVEALQLLIGGHPS